MDFYTNLTFKVQKGRGLGSCDDVTQFRNFGTPHNFWTNWAICFKFSTDIEVGTLLRVEHKVTPKWAWTWSRDPISKFWDPFMIFQRIELSAW